MNLKKYIPQIIAVVIFAAIAIAYFYPALQGYRIKQTDIKQHKGMSQELKSHKAKFDEEPLWLGNMFSGMPAYQVSTVRYSGNILDFMHKGMTLGFPYPIGLLFLYLIGFYILLLCLRINPWIAIIGAIAFAFSSYFIVIIEAGHTSKAFAIAYMAPLLGGIIALLRGRIWLGLVITSIFMGLELYANHLQITYYLAFVIAIVVIGESISIYKNEGHSILIKRLGLISLGVLIGLLPNLGNILTTYEYSKSSTRSLTELTIQPDGSSNKEIKSSGLDKDYITRWSYGKSESFTFLLPNAKGGKSGAIIGIEEDIERIRKEDPSFFNFLVSQYQNNKYIVDTYWGNLPFTSGPVYIGIIICFLAFLGIFTLRTPLAISLTLAGLLALLLSWGNNLMWFSEFFIDYFPMYNKFRAVSMILVLVELVVPILAILFLQWLLDHRAEVLTNKKRYLTISGLFVGVLIIFYISPDSFFDFLSEKDQVQIQKLIQKTPENTDGIYRNFEKVEEYRMEVFKSDIMNSLKFLILAIVLISLFIVDKLKSSLLIAGLGILVFVDLWMVDKHYLNNEEKPGARANAGDRYLKYEKLQQQVFPHAASPVDQAILQNELRLNPQIQNSINEDIQELKRENPRPPKGELETIQYTNLMRNTHYRVLNTLKRLDEDGQTAYFHKTLGGYHGAKMKKYQELVDFELGLEHFQLRNAFIEGGQQLVMQMLPQMNVINMLNAKYIIGAEKTKDGNRLTYLENPYRLGNAWFVDEVEIVDNADDEILALETLNPAKKAISRSEFSDELNGIMNGSGTVELTSYLPNELKYNYTSDSKQLIVFSEVYYEKGWNAYVNGKLTPHLKVNYILRGLVVDSGEGEIVFRFEPNTYAIGKATTWVGSISILILISLLVYKRVLPQKS